MNELTEIIRRIIYVSQRSKGKEADSYEVLAEKIAKKVKNIGLSEAIELFKKYRKEPMTGNVVIHELRGLRGDFK